MSTGSKFIATVWWPERRDASGVYHRSDLDVRIWQGTTLVASDTSGDGVFARAVVVNPAGNLNYRVEVTGYAVENMTANPPVNQDPGDGAAVADKQRYYMWVTPLLEHSANPS